MFKVNNKDTRTTSTFNAVVLVSLLLMLNIFHTFFPFATQNALQLPFFFFLSFFFSSVLLDRLAKVIFKVLSDYCFARM